MKEPELKITQRMLPHWEYGGSIYFVTFNTWERLELSPCARQVVLDACLFFNTQRYDLFALVIMPDHVHMLIQPLLKNEAEYWSLKRSPPTLSLHLSYTHSTYLPWAFGNLAPTT